ncbi:chemokine-like receptor 1 [Pygocentrus nattereri]|uniref:chemokine-like receptor 1 n=1 Tax=Pygocentrus nattereri TaxID=42514 RepID=UPI000814642C|nr:chemokine-like receptor 1 [Pygocentrus nattereri]
MSSTPVTETKILESLNHTIIPTLSPTSCKDATCIFFAVANVIILVTGVAGNGLVIWIAGFKMKKSVLSTWYLSLAVSDFLFCCTLPFGIVYAVKKEWLFGSFMCKIRYFVMFINMYSSIFLLAIISVDRCVVVMFPVWAQNKRTVRKATVMVILAWIMSATLSVPMAIFHNQKEKLVDNHMKRFCSRNYINYQNQLAVVASRFVFGCLIPFLIIFICYVVIIRKLKSNQMMISKKPFKIMTVLIVTFLICWLPFHIFSFLEMKIFSRFIGFGKVFGVTLASANSILNPILYTFMGKDFKKQCYAILSKIENALQEDEGHDTVQVIAFTTSEERRLPTTVQ